MKRRNKLVLLIAGVFFLSGLYSYVFPTKKETDQPRSIPSETRSLPESTHTSQDNSITESENQSGSSEEKPERKDKGTEALSLHRIAPSISQVRKEVQENPHTTPTSILAFGEQIGAKMEHALQSEEHAYPLFEEIKQCSLDSTLPVSIQAMCLSNAQILKETYANLEAQFNSLKEKASPEVIRLLDPTSSKDQP